MYYFMGPNCTSVHISQLWFPSIICTVTLLLRVTVEPIPADLGGEAGYTLDKIHTMSKMNNIALY